MMQLEAGMRVRCVDASTYGGRKHPRLTVGKEYSIVDTRRGEYVDIVDDHCKRGGWLANRFKPIVRVKAPTQRVIANGPFGGMTESDALDLVLGGY